MNIPGSSLSQILLGATAQGAARATWVEINRPLTALAVGNASSGGLPPTPTAAGASFSTATVSLPIGMDIKNILATESDINKGWMVNSFTFGTLNLVNPQGNTAGIPLAAFSARLAREDRLAPWILSKTKVDVQVNATLTNWNYLNVSFSAAGTDNSLFVQNVFHGFSLNAFQEEQVCAIQTRLDQTQRGGGQTALIGMFNQSVAAAAGTASVAVRQPPVAAGASPVMNPQIAALLQQAAASRRAQTTRRP